MHVKVTGSILIGGKFVKPGSVVEVNFHLGAGLVQRGDAVEVPAPAAVATPAPTPAPIVDAAPAKPAK